MRNTYTLKIRELRTRKDLGTNEFIGMGCADYIKNKSVVIPVQGDEKIVGIITDTAQNPPGGGAVYVYVAFPDGIIIRLYKIIKNLLK